MECARNLLWRVADRRHGDAGPPSGQGERRRRGERRDVMVSVMSLEDWAEAVSNFYYAQAHSRHRHRVRDRRMVDRGLLPGQQERRLIPERRQIQAANAEIRDWVEAMSNYYYHFHPTR